MDTIQEKAGLLQQQRSTSDSTAMEAVKDIEQRHDQLAANSRKSIEDLEWLAENLTVHQELCAGQAEWQKDMWDRLHAQTGQNYI